MMVTKAKESEPDVICNLLKQATNELEADKLYSEPIIFLGSAQLRNEFRRYSQSTAGITYQVDGENGALPLVTVRNNVSFTVSPGRAKPTWTPR
jgi:hypothetical protein